MTQMENTPKTIGKALALAGTSWVLNGKIPVSNKRGV